MANREDEHAVSRTREGPVRLSAKERRPHNTESAVKSFVCREHVAQLWAQIEEMPGLYVSYRMLQRSEMFCLSFELMRDRRICLWQYRSRRNARLESGSTWVSLN